LAFGDTFAVFTQPEKFLSMVKSAVQEWDLHMWYGPVEYVSRTGYNGDLGPFKKFDTYEYQSEFRIVVSKGKGQPLLLKLGNLSDMIITGPSAELNERIRLDHGRLPSSDI
jgi:hypothetical protein